MDDPTQLLPKKLAHARPLFDPQIIGRATKESFVKLNPAALANIALSPDAKPMAENVFRALWAFLFTAIVVMVVSMLTKPRPVAELDGLVYGATVLPKEEPVPFYKNEWAWAFLVVIIFAALNIIFW